MKNLRFNRTYTVTITEPGCSPQDFSFNNLNERQIFLKEKYAEQRERQLDEEATIKSVTTEDSIAGTIYAELCQIESEDYYSFEDYQSEFYDETDDEGDPALSDEALITLVEHVSRLNSFFNGMIQRNHLIDLLNDIEGEQLEYGSYFLQEREYQCYKPTDIGTLNFEDGSRLFVLNHKNSEKQEQAFSASLLFWFEGKYYS